jgi:SOS-response transcriptional repressor LexA
MEISIGSRIKQIRLSKGLTQKEFADSLGIVQGFLSGLERGKKSPSDTLLIALCHLYEINQEWLEIGVGEIYKEPPMSAENRQCTATTKIPLLNQIPPEFPDKISDQDVFDYISLPHMPEGCFSIINYGDFMAPTIRDGDLVIFRPDTEVQNRDIVLVHNRWGETILRRYRLRTNEIFLAPDNPAYAPFKPDPNTRIVGKVVDVWRKVQL